MRKFLTVAAICGLMISASGQGFEQVQRITEQEVLQAEKELAELRTRIDAESGPLATRLNALESEVIRMRAEAAQLRARVEGGESSLLQLQERVRGLQDNNNYLGNLLSDYITRFSTLTHISEYRNYEGEIREANEARENEALDDAQRFNEQLEVLNLSLQRMERALGGYIFQAEALGGDSIAREGKIVLLGPLSYFANEEVAGITFSPVNAQVPQIRQLRDPGAQVAIQTLAQNGEAIVPVDTTGQAYQIERAKDTILDEWKKGGMVQPFIIILALLAFLVAIYKWFELSKVRPAKQKDIDTILEHLANGRRDEAMAYAKSIRGPVGEMLETAVEHADEDREIIEEVLYEKIITTQPMLERMLPFIAVTAATAPLLGLLGTVTGMMKTFQLITIVGTGDARSLSSGISEALITTKWGLISAIPALILHAMLSRKAKSVIGSMEQSAVSFINGVVEIREGSATRSA